jgi:hypothetical protein
MKMPNEIIEKIMEYKGEKEEIKKYFIEEIGSKIDKSLIYIENECEFCYIEKLKSGDIAYCDICYQGLNIEKAKKKWFSATCIINSKSRIIGELYNAIYDLEKFMFIMRQTDWYSNHPLSWLHYELKRTIIKIE